MRSTFKYVIIAFIVFAIGIFVGKERGIPFVATKGEWAIGIYSGSSLVELSPIAGNPVLTAAHVTDRKAAFVADPFMIEVEGIWYMFFEVLDMESDKGVIGLATSPDGVSWRYDSIVLDEPFHLSYPQVFSVNGEFYMIPETHRRHAVMLYRANPFPRKWEPVSKLIDGRFVDPTVLRFNGYWWMFTTESKDSVRLFFSETIEGEWREHPESPIVEGDPERSRPAGRVLSMSGVPFRVAQDCAENYGEAVNVFRISKLSPENYEEVALMNRPFLKGTGYGWNAKRMHHLDAHELADGSWRACVDGYSRRLVFGLQE